MKLKSITSWIHWLTHSATIPTLVVEYPLFTMFWLYIWSTIYSIRINIVYDRLDLILNLNTIAQQLFYMLLIGLYEKFSESRILGEKLKIQLLRGLSDSADDIKNVLIEFWQEKKRLSLEIFERLQQLVMWESLHSFSLPAHFDMYEQC